MLDMLVHPHVMQHLMNEETRMPKDVSWRTVLTSMWVVQQMQLQYQRQMQMTMQQQLRAQQALMQAQLRAAQAQVQQYQEQVWQVRMAHVFCLATDPLQSSSCSLAVPWLRCYSNSCCCCVLGLRFSIYSFLFACGLYCTRSFLHSKSWASAGTSIQDSSHPSAVESTAGG